MAENGIVGGRGIHDCLGDHAVLVDGRELVEIRTTDELSRAQSMPRLGPAVPLQLGVRYPPGERVRARPHRHSVDTRTSHPYRQLRTPALR